MGPQPPWEDEGGILVLRLYKTDEHAEWECDVNKSDLQPDWPRVVLLDLSAKQFAEFDSDPKQFTIDHNIFPEQPIQFMSKCAKPPEGKGKPCATEKSRWLVVIPHGKPSAAASAAVPFTMKPCK